jgi:hypothetical protein
MLKSALHCFALAVAIPIDIFVLDFPLCTYAAFGILVYFELFKRGRNYDHKSDLGIVGKLSGALVAAWVLNMILSFFVPIGSGNATGGFIIFLFIAVGPLLFMMGMYALALSAGAKRT